MRFKRLRSLIGTSSVLVVIAAATILPAGESIQAPLASKSLLLDGAAVDGRLIVVGERGHILVSEDGGLIWRQAEVPTRATLTAVWFHDRDRGWAVGHDAVIVRTEDGGSSWKLVHEAPDEELPLLDVWFADADRGLAIGAYGYLLRSSDGGRTWSAGEFDPQSAEEGDDEEWGDAGDLHLNQIAAADGRRLYIAAEAGSVFRSDDGGASWIELASPYEGSFFGTLPLDVDSVLLFGLRGRLFRSDDAGRSWTRLESGTEALIGDGRILEDGTIVLVGLGGTVLASRDGGRRFEAYPREDRQGLATLLPDGRGGLVLVGEFGVTRVERPGFSGQGRGAAEQAR